MSKPEVRTYRAIYMLPSIMEEKAADEFIQKFEQEIINLGGAIEVTNKGRQQMVRTAANKGNRHVYLATTYFKVLSTSIATLNRFLRLAQGVCLNFMILTEEESQNYAAA
ncbi:MAG: hypothetical protein ACK481_03865 [Candidatus Melainabacteria bacterium]|jgi:ribosomal protein S6